LITRGASVLEPDRSGWLPLHWAAVANRVEVVRFFVSLGAPLEARGTDQWTALHLACISGSSRAVAALVRAGADVDSVARGGNTPLHLALVPRKLRTVKILLLGGQIRSRRTTEQEHRAQLLAPRAFSTSLLSLK